MRKAAAADGSHSDNDDGESGKCLFFGLFLSTCDTPRCISLCKTQGVPFDVFLWCSPDGGQTMGGCVVTYKPHREYPVISICKSGT